MMLGSTMTTGGCLRRSRVCSSGPGFLTFANALKFARMPQCGPRPP